MSVLTKAPRNTHAAGIYADMSVDGPAIGTLVCIIDRAKNLPNRKTIGKQNPYCAARLGKEAKKTETDLRGGQTPKWDHELRFTVHESPDYLKLKLSVFNDDKRTDLIGETWIDLKDIIIPGGSQKDQWHPLQFRGKYAGEVRIEMTYYDSRPEDEAVIEKRKEAADRGQTMVGAPAPASSVPTGVSGPRQLKDVKRRPLPTEPIASGSALPDQPPAPLQTTPMRPATFDDLQPPAHHPGPANMAAGVRPSTSQGYEHPETLRSDWNVTLPGVVPDEGARRYHSKLQGSQNEQHAEQYDPRMHTVRPHPDSDRQVPAEYRPASLRHSPAEHAAYGSDTRSVHSSSRQNVHSVSPLEPARYHTHHGSHGQLQKFTTDPYAQLQEPAYLASAPLSTDRDRYHGRNGSSAAVGACGSAREVAPHEDCDSGYASMQPRVEDEEEDEGIPPPPPIHRSGLGQPAAPSAPPSYHAYSPNHARGGAPPDPMRPASGTPVPSYASHTLSQHPPLQEFPSDSDPAAMPPSLVAGYDPSIADAESDRAARETRAIRRNSAMVDGVSQAAPPPGPAAYDTAVVNPLRSSPRPVSRGHSAGAGNSMVPRRKSVSPHPPSVTERGGSSIPFSPDSYNSINPNVSRSAASRETAPPYETLAGAREAAVRTETAATHELEPIIGDDGREIDPSDHLPAETWAPEPERKSRKPEVIIRFKHSPKANTGRPKHTISSQVAFKSPALDEESYSTERTDGRRAQPANLYSSGAAESHRPRSRDEYGGAGASHYQHYGTPAAVDSPRTSQRGSVSPSPTPGSRSSHYAPSYAGPPIPAKIPVAQPINHHHANVAGNPGMDALAMELQSIDIGSVGRRSDKGARQYGSHHPPSPASYPV